TRSKRDWSSDVCASDLRPLLVAYIALQRHGHRMVNYYSAGTCRGSDVERSLFRKLKLNVTRSGLYVPITFLHAINANVSASRLRSEERRVGKEWLSGTG